MIETQIKIDLRYSVEVILRRIDCSSWCAYCHQIVDLLSVSEAASIAKTNPRTMFIWMRSGKVHCLNSRRGELICASSIDQSEAVTGELRLSAAG